MSLHDKQSIKPIFDITPLFSELESILKELNHYKPTVYSINQYYYYWQEPTYTGYKENRAYVTIISNDNKHYGVFRGDKLIYIIANPRESFFDALADENVGIYPYDGAVYGELIYSYK